MTRSNIYWKIDGLASFIASIPRAQIALKAQSEIAMWESVRLVESEAKARVPRKTGRLMASIDSDVDWLGSTVQGEVGTRVEYARPIEFGQMAHYIAGREISAQTGMTKLLKWQWGGRTWFKPWVYHPGARAHEFLGGALEASTEIIVDRFRKVRDNVIEILGRYGA